MHHSRISGAIRSEYGDDNHDQSAFFGVDRVVRYTLEIADPRIKPPNTRILVYSILFLM